MRSWPSRRIWDSSLEWSSAMAGGWRECVGASRGEEGAGGKETLLELGMGSGREAGEHDCGSLLLHGGGVLGSARVR